jgi:hypothetical protein
MIEQLDLPVAELDKLSTAQLKTIQDQIASAEDLLKKRKGVFEAVLVRRFEKDAKAKYLEEKKDTGTVRLTAPGSNLLELKVEVDKKVEWDQAKTMAWLNKQTPENAKHFGKLKVEIPEAKYTAAPPATQTELRAFRTLKPGKMKFSLVEKEIVEPAQEAA